MKHVVCHVDVNSAFLSWTAADRLSRLHKAIDIRKIPAVIGGDQSSRRGIVLASSIPAKAYGITTGEPLFQALRKCPELVILPPDYNLYINCSAQLMELLMEMAPLVEQYSIDEAWIDLSGTEKLYGSPVAMAEKIKNRIRDDLGFTVNIGVSVNKILAKMASDFVKPDRVHTLFPEELAEKLWPLPVGKLFFVGPASQRKLFLLGIYTIGDLAHADPAHLRLCMHKHGEIIWNYANGRCDDAVTADNTLNKGYGNSTTTPLDIIDKAAAYKVLLSLSETVGARMRRDGQYGSFLTVHLRSSSFHDFSRQTRLTQPTNLTMEIYHAACAVFDALWDGLTPLRHLGVYVNGATKCCLRQGQFFVQDNYHKLSQVDQVVDAIRQRFGREAIKRACLTQKEDKHMSGGALCDPYGEAINSR